jgi:murein DD-endopeptidase MepM/ murein hydrolase activator NlpD
MSTYKIKYGDTLSTIASNSGKSINELMQLNPSIADPNKIRAGASLNLGGVADPASTGKTVAQNETAKKGSIIEKAKMEVPDFSYTSEENQAKSLYESDYKSATKSKQEQEAEDQKVRAASRARLQGLIDTINLATQDQIAKFKNTTGKDRQGQSYALAAAGGRVGSATGEAEIRNVEDMNRQEENTYLDEANAKIASLMNQADKDATSEIQARRASIQQGAEKYLDFLSNVSQRKQSQASAFIKNMLALGIDPSSLSDTDFEKLQAQYGVTKESLISLYNDAKTSDAQAKAEAAKSNTFDLSEGESRYVYDPVTGEAKLVASKAKTYAPTSGSGSSGGYVVGSNPAVDSWVGQINAGKATISNVPANLKNAVVQALNSAAPTDQSSSYQVGVLKSALENVKKTKGAAGASGVGKFLGDAFIGNTQFRQLEAYIDTVKSNLLALATDPNIKKFFGPQMSNRDVELMTSIASSIDAQRLKPEQIQEEINKIEEFITKYEAAAAASNVDMAGASTEVPTATGYTSASGKTYKLPN